MWTATAADGSDLRILVIVTTIALEPGDKGYKKSLVERLSRAARDYLADSNEAASFLLIPRLRDWGLSRIAEKGTPVFGKKSCEIKGI